MIGIILQARMGSARLPGKVLKRIGTRTLLGHIFFRLGSLRHDAKLVLATGESAGDDVLRDICAASGVECFRGSESNVLERYFRCAGHYGFSSVVRLTGDNPFTDVEELDDLIALYERSKADFCHSFRSLPVGVGAEIFSFKALEHSARNAKAAHHLEHVDEYILEHPELFRTLELEVPADKNRPDIRLTVDTPDDYRKACYIVEHASSEPVSTKEAIALCSRYA